MTRRSKERLKADSELKIENTSPIASQYIKVGDFCMVSPGTVGKSSRSHCVRPAILSANYASIGHPLRAEHVEHRI